MLTYYKFHLSHFKLNSEKTFFQQVNNFPNEKTIIYGQIGPSVEALHEMKVRDNWTEITEEEYNTVKAEVLAFLSAN